MASWPFPFWLHRCRAARAGHPRSAPCGPGAPRLVPSLNVQIALPTAAPIDPDQFSRAVSL